MVEDSENLKSRLQRLLTRLHTRPGRPRDALDGTAGQPLDAAGILERAGDAVLQLDSRGTVVFANQAALDLFGVVAARCVGNKVFDFFHSEDRQEGEAWFLGCLAMRTKSASLENRVENRRSQYACVVAWSFTFTFDKEGGFASAVCVGHDITFSRWAKQAIQPSSREWERTFDAVPDAMCVLTADHRIHRLNKAMAERIGVHPYEAIGQH